MFKLRFMALSAALMMGLSSCAGNLPGSEAPNDAFSLLANEQVDQKQHRRGKHHKRGHHGMMFGFLARDLNLTDAQKAEFKSLMQAGREEHKAMGTQMKAFKQSVKTAFLSDSFDANALQAEWAQIKAQNTNPHQKMAEKMVQAWNILTPAQQAKVEERMNKLEERMARWEGKKGEGQREGKHGKKLARLTQALDLTPEQQATLKTRWESNQAERQDRRARMKSVKNAVFAQLKAGGSAADVAQAMAPMMDSMEGKSSKYLNRLAGFHDVLTAEQRQKLVTLMEQHKHKRHHGRR